MMMMMMIRRYDDCDDGAGDHDEMCFVDESLLMVKLLLKVGVLFVHVFKLDPTWNVQNDGKREEKIYLYSGLAFKKLWFAVRPRVSPKLVKQRRVCRPRELSAEVRKARELVRDVSWVGFSVQGSVLQFDNYPKAPK